MSDPLTALIVHADCELSRLFHSHAFDLTVTSPPYGDLREYGIDFNRAGQGWHSVSMDIRADQCELAKRRIEAEVPGVEVWIDKAKESEVV